MKLRLDSILIGSSAMLLLTLTTPGCARRAAEEAPEPPAPPPVMTVDPVEVTAPAPVEAPPPAPVRLDLVPVFFDFDSYRLEAVARERLDEAAKALRERPDAQVTIEGHCDERGTVEYNMALGERRASAAREYLIAAGVSPERIRIISYGEEHPFDEGHDDAAWSKNRRAHFVVRQAELTGSPTAASE